MRPKKTILCVDDNEQILSVRTFLLETRGYRVIALTSPLDALETIKNSLTDRIDYLCPLTNNLAYCLAVEKLLGLEIPPKAQWMRVLMNELTRINSHLVWLGTHAMDLGA